LTDLVSGGRRKERRRGARRSSKSSRPFFSFSFLSFPPSGSDVSHFHHSLGSNARRAKKWKRFFFPPRPFFPPFFFPLRPSMPSAPREALSRDRETIRTADRKSIFDAPTRKRRRTLSFFFFFLPPSSLFSLVNRGARCCFPRLWRRGEYGGVFLSKRWEEGGAESVPFPPFFFFRYSPTVNIPALCYDMERGFSARQT